MEAQTRVPESQKSTTTTPPPPIKSCWKKKSDDAYFLEDLKDHLDEFVNASMDEHKTCFQKTISKMFGMSKIIAERNAAKNTNVNKVENKNSRKNEDSWTREQIKVYEDSFAVMPISHKETQSLRERVAKAIGKSVEEVGKYHKKCVAECEAFLIIAHHK